MKSAIVRVDELFTVNPSAEKSELQLQFEVCYLSTLIKQSLILCCTVFQKLMMIKETLSCTTTSPRCSSKKNSSYNIHANKTFVKFLQNGLLGVTIANHFQ